MGVKLEVISQNLAVFAFVRPQAQLAGNHTWYSRLYSELMAFEFISTAACQAQGLCI